MNARGDVGELLTAQLDVIDPSDLIRQRDSARAWAAEYMRRVDIAEAFAHDMHCDCTPLADCPKHYLLRVLAGDE